MTFQCASCNLTEKDRVDEVYTVFWWSISQKRTEVDIILSIQKSIGVKDNDTVEDKIIFWIFNAKINLLLFISVFVLQLRLPEPYTCVLNWKRDNNDFRNNFASST